MKTRHRLAALAITALAIATPARAQDEAIDLFDPSIGACSSAPDAAWYYQINGGSDERCQISDIRSPLVDAVWGCTSGDCSALTASSGDTIDAGSADSAKPATRSTSLPGTCAEGQVHQDTDSGGSETYICTATDTWTKLVAVGETSYSYLLDTKTSSTTVDNTVTETSIYSYAIPGGTLGVNDALQLTLFNEYLNTSGASRGWTIKVKFGGSTVFSAATPSNFYGSSSIRWVFQPISIYLQMLGATNAQIITYSAEFPSGSSSGTFAVGQGQGITGAVNHRGNSNALSVDTTSNQTLEVTVELSAAHADHEWECYSGTLEHLVNP